MPPFKYPSLLFVTLMIMHNTVFLSLLTCVELHEA